MTGRSRLVVRWVGMAAASLALLIAARRSVPVPPFWHPGRMPGWWRQSGPVVATFGVLRALLLLASCYLTALWTVALVSWHLPHAGWVGFARRARLPGARLVARSALGLTAAGAVWAAGLEASLAAGTTPARPTTGAANGDESPAPVLRYLGPAPVRAPDQGPDLGPVGGPNHRPPLSWAPVTTAAPRPPPAAPVPHPASVRTRRAPRTAPPSGREATTPATGRGGETATGAPTAGARRPRPDHQRPHRQAPPPPAPTAGHPATSAPPQAPRPPGPSTSPTTRPPHRRPPDRRPPDHGRRAARRPGASVRCG